MFEETLLSGRFVKGEEVRAENKVEGLPLLGGGTLVGCICGSRLVRYLCLSGALLHLSTPEHTVKSEATVLIDR